MYIYICYTTCIIRMFSSISSAGICPICHKKGFGHDEEFHYAWSDFCLGSFYIKLLSNYDIHNINIFTTISYGHSAKSCNLQLILDKLKFQQCINCVYTAGINIPFEQKYCIVLL